MEENVRNDKMKRVLDIYTKLLNGTIINKAQEAQEYQVNKRSIQRDIDEIRAYLASEATSKGYTNAVEYDRQKNGYRMERLYDSKLSNGEVLALCKILLDSRAFPKDDMEAILDKLINNCVPEANQIVVKELIRNETFHYIEPRHKTHFIDKMWNLGIAVKNKQYLEIEYLRLKDKTIVKRRIKPVGIMFSEFYFYLTAFIDDEKVRKGFDVINDSFPTIYRIDRIKALHVCEEKFHIPYKDRFEEGEFRKRIQFMYGGELHKVKFTYSGPDIDAVLDRLPTAEVLSEKEGVYTISAEVFGKGIDMWIRSQGEHIKMI